MAANESAFDFINPLQNTVLITIGNGEKVPAAGIGSVTLELIQKHGFNGKHSVHPTITRKHTFNDVYYVSGVNGKPHFRHPTCRSQHHNYPP